jgi:hypothetical protein
MEENKGVTYLCKILNFLLKNKDIEIESFNLRASDEEFPNLEIYAKNNIWIEITYIENHSALEIVIEKGMVEREYIFSDLENVDFEKLYATILRGIYSLSKR